jgi:nucleotide-binding universal stress UspA family protein
MKLQHILVPLDFSEPSQQALDYATQLAEKLQARLTLLHVIQTPVVAGGPGLGTDATLVPYMEQMEAEMQQKIEAVVQQVRQHGLPCDAAVVHGAPFQQIVDLATSKQVDLIVMGTHGHTGLQHLLLGSVAEKVVRLAPCAVLVTRSPADQSSTEEAS